MTRACFSAVMLLELAIASLQPASAQDAQENPIAVQVRRLDAKKNDSMTRVTALRRLGLLLREQNSPEGLAALERSLKQDPDAVVRVEAVEVLGGVALVKKPAICPLAILQAFEDADVDVRGRAMGLAGVFRAFAPGSTPLLHRLGERGMPVVRGMALLLLTVDDPKSDKTHALIQKAVDDPDEVLVDMARPALFELTRKLEDIVPYSLRRQEGCGEGSPRPKEPPAKTEEEERHRNLRMLAALLRLHALGEERPEEMVKHLMAHLQGPAADMRRATANFLGNYADPSLWAMLPTAKKPLLTIRDGTTDSILIGEPRPTPKGKEDVEKTKPMAPPPKILVLLQKAGAGEVLRQLVDKDADEGARVSARYALKRWTALPK